MDIQTHLKENIPPQNTPPVSEAPSIATLAQWALLFGVATLSILLDQLTKWIVVQSLDYGETWVPIKTLENIFDITYTRNTGAAFGMAQDASNIFLIVAVIVVGAIVYYYRKLPYGSTLMRLALGLQMGGALGNAIDRVNRGYVVDFFHVHDFPIFNVADSSIVVGVLVLVVVLWWQDTHQNPKSEAEVSGGEF